MIIQIHAPKPYIHQGATIQRTDPVPVVSGPNLAQQTALHQTRYLVAAKADVHQGATQQQTSPIPPVLTRPDAWFGPTSATVLDARRMVGPLPQFDGATRQQTYPIPPTKQPADGWYGATSPYVLDGRRMTGPRAMVDQGATVQPLFQFFPNLPEFRYYVRITPCPIFRPIEGPTVQQTYEFAIAQPSDVRRRVIDVTRVPLAPVITQAAVSSDVYGSTPSLASWFMPRPRQDVVVPSFTGTVSADVFGVNPPPVSWFVPRPRQDVVVPSLTGPTVQATFVFPPNQPDFAAWFKPSALRYLVQPNPPLSTVTIVATDVYRFNPTDLSPWLLKERARLLGGPIAQVTGSTIQATFPVPQTTQPELIAYRLLASPRYTMTLASPTLTVPVTTADVFPLASVDLSAWLLRERARLLGGPASQVAGTTVQATHPIPAVSQPELNAFRLLHTPKYLVAPTPPVVMVATVVQSDVFRPEALDVSRWILPTGRFIVAAPIRLDGPPVQATHPVPPVSQPELTAFARLQLARSLGGPIRQFDGLTPQQTSFVFPVSQPLFEYYRRLAAAFRVDATPRFDGATSQATFIFPPNQADSRWFIPVMRVRMVGPTAQREHVPPAASLQPYLVPQGQPTPYAFRRPGVVAWDMPYVWMPQGSWNELDGGVVILVGAEARVILVDAEPHIILVGAEPRTATVDAGSREIVVLSDPFIIEPEDN